MFIIKSLGTLFKILYLLTVDDDDEGEQSRAKRPKATTLGIELQEFRDTRVPIKDPTQFWRYSVLTRLRTLCKDKFLGTNIFCRRGEVVLPCRQPTFKNEKENVTGGHEEISIHPIPEKVYRNNQEADNCNRA
ncbi:hypothetical protein LOD99_15134 [Oopsacas minuta]|uniref:Uncharacterized protein n=1 Tax=Oopsacas minuta TaxID=111878 RepID=A0AAV7KDV5_9METZ|nr:hypothetical protein LOD99_15134 [Oopsacas minuta]